MKRKTWLPSPGLIVGVTALVVAMAGSAIALPGTGRIEAGDLKRGAVKTQALHHRAVTTQKIQRQAVRGGKLAHASVKPGKLKAGAVTTSKLANGAITGVKVANDSIDATKLADRAVIQPQKVAAAGGANLSAARDAAAPALLFEKGPLSLYAKCFTDTSSDTTYGYVYAATRSEGSVLLSDEDKLAGGPFLDPDTAEAQREAIGQRAGNDSARGAMGELQLVAGDGTAVQGQMSALVKNGDLPGSDPVYGPGDMCVFSGGVSG
jgi:hypothetical protein